jgi:hypothetical protein
MYAKSIYEYFGATRVLDPCAGWGDRMVGAFSSTTVKRYVGFDPNYHLRDGYRKIMSDFEFKETVSEKSHSSFSISDKYSCDIYSLPFESGSSRLGQETFDFAFTSPPFFDYEDYTETNPKYVNWFTEFYEPLFQIVERHLKPNKFFAIHIDDTSAGKIRDFLFRGVKKISGFQYCGKIGLVGGKSGKTRNVYLYQRADKDA